MTKFHKDWAKIVDFLIKAHFSMCPIFFAPDFSPQKSGVWGTRFGYFDFRLNFLNLLRNGAILPKILCRIQIWASKIGLPTG